MNVSPLTTLAHAGHVHAEKEVAAMATIPPMSLLIGSMVVVLAIVVVVVLYQRSANRTSTAPVKTGDDQDRT